MKDGPAPPRPAPLRPFATAPTEGAPCQRCGFPVPPKLMGCKNPCPNCGTVYPHGDCSD
jgi:hypothetical protein